MKVNRLFFLTFQFQNIYLLHLKGILIKTQQFSKEVCVGGCKEFIYYESQLDLLDVTTFASYQCAANIDQQLVSKTISFLIKGNEPEVDVIFTKIDFDVSQFSKNLRQEIGNHNHRCSFNNSDADTIALPWNWN